MGSDLHHRLPSRADAPIHAARQRGKVPLRWMAVGAAGTCLALGGTLFPARAFAIGSKAESAQPAFSLAIPVEKNRATAGYISERPGITTVSTTFEVPEIVSCTSGHNAGMGPVVILLGNRYFVGAGAEAECQGGVTSYMVAINHNGSENHPLTVAAQDEISVDITVGPGAVVIKIDDLTSNKKTGETVVKGKVTAAEFGDDTLYQGKQEVPIPRFTDHQFKYVKVNGQVLSRATPLIDDELVAGKTVLIEAGAIDKAGDSFIMHFVHAT